MNFEDWEYRERSYVDAINISGKSLLRLVNSVHDFTKIELNELKVYKAKCKLRDIIKCHNRLELNQSYLYHQLKLYSRLVNYPSSYRSPCASIFMLIPLKEIFV